MMQKTLIAAMLGIGSGLFLGPLCSIFHPIASIFGMLLQMVLLPYICFSLIHGLGSIFPHMGIRLFKNSWQFVVVLWVIATILVLFAAWLIPTSSPVLINVGESQEKISYSETLLNFIVPENPFYDLANNIIPAIAFFGIIIGSGLMFLEKKEPLCSLIERIIKVFEKILHWIAVVAPIGVFANLAVSSGSIDVHTLSTFHFYIFGFICISLVMTCVIIPTFLCYLTHMSYRDVMEAIVSVCLLPFATGVVGIMIPFFIAYLKKESEQKDLYFHSSNHPKKFHEMGQVVLPIAYTFGQIGNCAVILCFFFLSYYYRHPLFGSESSLASVIGLPITVALLASSSDAVSFLTTQFGFPETAKEMFADTSNVLVYFQSLMSSAGILALILLSMHAYYNVLKIRWRPLVVRIAIVFAVLGVIIVGLKHRLHFSDHYRDLFYSLRVSDVIQKPVKTSIYTSEQLSKPRSDFDAVFANILETGSLKVGYNTEVLPFCYWNTQHELVGYDIAFMYQLGIDLDCALEFIPLQFDAMAQELNGGLYDIAVSAVIMTEERIKEMNFTQPYREENTVLIVPTEQASQFLNLDALFQSPQFKIGCYNGAFMEIAKRYFPKAKVVQVPFNASSVDRKNFFKQGTINAFLWSQTSAMTWCLMHPGYTVIDYNGLLGKSYVAYAIHTNSTKLLSFLNSWLLLKKLSGFQQEMDAYWFEGKKPKR